MNNINIGETYEWKTTTNYFLGKVIRELDDSERDPEVGRMFEITIQVYADERVVE